jgi:hypothetical protein
MGLQLSNDYKYIFLLNQFSCLKNNEEKEFRQFNYPLLEVDIEQYMEGVEQYVRMKKQNKAKKIKRLKKVL